MHFLGAGGGEEEPWCFGETANGEDVSVGGSEVISPAKINTKTMYVYINQFVCCSAFLERPAFRLKWSPLPSGG